MADKLFEPGSGPLTVAYQPDVDTRLLENPPRFTWMAATVEEGHRYRLEISKDPQFMNDTTIGSGRSRIISLRQIGHWSRERIGGAMV